MPEPISKNLPIDPANAIAIIGMAVRLPGADTLSEFWKNLRDGVESLTHFTDEELLASGILPRWVNHPDYVKANAILSDVAGFDAEFFDIPPSEAEVMDPQQRIFLELAWEAMESAGHPPLTYPGRIGVYAGERVSEYLSINQDPIELIGITDASPILTTQRLWSNDKDYLATRVSFKLNLTGPAMTVQTACSTSLVAMHLSIQAILAGECDLAIAGGITIRVPQKAGYLFTEGMIFSSDAKTRTFDAQANGTIFSSGAGAVVLKRLDRALADGDFIRAIVRGSAINNDGGGVRKSKFHSPSVPGQAEVVRDALAAAGVDPATITYVEAHGTATQIGDPIEFNGLVQAFGDVGEKTCAIGSVKSNIGHTGQAAGAVGVIKVALMFEHEALVPTLNYNRPNPRIDLDNSPFWVNVEHRPWEATGAPRRAGVSSYGVGGTNAHVVLEEPPRRLKLEAPVAYPPLLALSARNEEALHALAGRYARYLEQNPDAALDDLCFTANAGRTHFDHRLAVYAESAEALRASLAAYAAGESPDGLYRGVRPEAAPAVAFLFTGQGSQYPDMGRGLYETEPVFRRALDECSTLLEPLLGKSLLEILYSGDEEAAELLNETACTQPALFALEYALAQLWASWGVVPDFVLGHSVGEYTAACIAGGFSLADGLRLIAHRGRLMGALPQDGGMAALAAGPERVRGALAGFEGQVEIAALNGPENTVVSGLRTAVRQVCERLEADGIRARPLNTSHAFHSHLMEPMLDEFEQFARTIDYAQPAIPLISNLTGEPVEQIDAAYWRRHVREAVRFQTGIETLAGLGCTVFVEIGPSPVLSGMAQAALPNHPAVWLPSLRKQAGGKLTGGVPGGIAPFDRAQISRSLGALYAAGRDVAWNRLAPDAPRRRLELPHYPFQRRRYWVEPPARSPVAAVPAGAPAAVAGEPVHPLLGVRLDSPLADIQFAGELRPDSPAFLDAHRAFETVTVPATAHIEMVSAALHLVFGLPGQVTTLHDVFLRKALLIPEETRRQVRVVVSPEEGLDGQPLPAGAFRIFSRESGPDGEWVLHSSGKFTVETAQPAPRITDLEALQKRFVDEQPVADFYRLKDARDLRLGDAFRGVRKVWRGDGEALARISLPGGAAASIGYHVHPALLDSCLQVAASAYTDPTAANELFLPGAWDRITIHGPVPDRLWTHAMIRGEASLRNEVRSYDLLIYDETGRLAISIAGLHMKRARRTALFGEAESGISAWLHAIEWEPQPLPALSPAAAPAGRVLVFASEAGADAGAGVRLAELLAERGWTPTLVHPDAGRKNGATGSVRFPWLRLDPADREGFFKLLSGDGSGPVAHILYAWALAAAAGSPTGDRSAHREPLRGLLHLARTGAESVGAGAPFPRLWIVTRGAQPAGPQPGPFAPEQAPLWGLGRVIGRENPEFSATLVDLDPAGQEDFTPLLDEMATPNDERQVAFRGAARYAPRLFRLGDASRAGNRLSLPGDRPFRLESTRPGTLDGLAISPALRRTPGPGEIEIRVRAAGLNFRDVLIALGRFEDVIGRECSGTVAAVGAGVSAFADGDRVMAVAPGSFASYVTIDARHAVRMPAHLNFEQAATIPLAFLTAHYGLITLAGLSAGERVLVHAAAGGVGHAAIQVARAAGAEVITTASRGKWAYLRSLGIEHILDSRSTDFAEEVLRLTGGRGVDVVLNSLAGEFIPASLDALAENGRFIEIGATDVWDAERVAQVRPDVAYHWFHLGESVGRKDPDFLRSMFAAVAACFETGAYRPLPYVSFDFADAGRAFRLMSQARHIGKIVLTHRGPTLLKEGGAPSVRIDPEKTYVLTGAFGGLGLRTAAWLADQGARHLALIGRRPPGEAAGEVLSALELRGLDVRVFLADNGDAEALARAWTAVRETMPPPDGIFHLAGLLDDGMLAGQDWARFERVLAPKVAGAWHLHRLSEGLPLSHFVLFSSVASLWGNAGRGNYAAANAFLDGLAHYRRAHGLPAQSINWAAWSEVGMAADLGDAVERRRAAAGMEKIDPARGMEALARILGEDAAQAAVIPMDWRRYLDQTPEIERSTFFSAVRPADRDLARAKPEKPAAAEAGILRELAAAGPARQEAVLAGYLQAQISRIGGIPVSAVDSTRSLADLGIDSLMAVELRNRITADLDLQVPMSLFLGNPDIRHLGVFLLEQLDRSPAADSRSGRVNGSPEKPAPAALPADPLLVPLQREGTGRPFFCVHGFGGGVLGYGELARLVGPGRPFIGIRALGMDGEAEPDETVEAMAVRYVEAIRSVQPAGPYDLGGYCLGGVVAFEMARQLKSAGEGVGLVAVIEGHAPGGVRERVRLASRLPAIWRSLPYWFQDYWKLGFKGIRRRILLKTARWRPRRAEPGMAQVAPQDLVDDDISGLPEHHLRIMTLQILAHRAYITRPFGGKVTVFRARDQSIGKIVFGTLDPSLGWGRYADEVEVVEVEGGHRDLHLKPHVPSLAGALGKVLEES